MERGPRPSPRSLEGFAGLIFLLSTSCSQKYAPVLYTILPISPPNEELVSKQQDKPSVSDFLCLI